MTTAIHRGVIPTLTFSQRLVVAREHIGLNQGELSSALGVSTNTIQRAESGRAEPRRPTIMAWAMATGVDLHWLETGHVPTPDGGGTCEGCAIRDLNPEPADLASLHVLAAA